MKITKDQTPQQIADMVNPVLKSLKKASKVEKCKRCDGHGRGDG